MELGGRARHGRPSGRSSGRRPKSIGVDVSGAAVRLHCATIAFVAAFFLGFLLEKTYILQLNGKIMHSLHTEIIIVQTDVSSIEMRLKSRSFRLALELFLFFLAKHLKSQFLDIGIISRLGVEDSPKLKQLCTCMIFI